MAKTIEVTYQGKKCYNIEMRFDFTNICEQIQKLGYSSECKICIVSDSNVSDLYLDALKTQLQSEYQNLYEFIFTAGEASKNLNTVQKLYEHLILSKFDRKDLLIALGGGVVGDLTGYTAATYLRGIDFIQVPTSLLSQVDSSIGGKTGVDFSQYKNMVGAFYQPRLVYMNLSVLHSLPQKQISSGIGEILKHGLIKDQSYFHWMQEHASDIWALKDDVMEQMIYESCLIKRGVVERDPKEQGERALLNFGHTIGHAVEKLSDFSLFHGECVALGMVSAAYLSHKLGNISSAQLQEIEDTIRTFRLPTRISDYNENDILAATKSDKKMEANQIKFVILESFGTASIYKDFSDEDLLESIRYIITNH